MRKTCFYIKKFKYLPGKLGDCSKSIIAFENIPGKWKGDLLLKTLRNALAFCIWSKNTPRIRALLDGKALASSAKAKRFVQWIWAEILSILHLRKSGSEIEDKGILIWQLKNQFIFVIFCRFPGDLKHFRRYFAVNWPFANIYRPIGSEPKVLFVSLKLSSSHVTACWFINSVRSFGLQRWQRTDNSGRKGRKFLHF